MPARNVSFPDLDPVCYHGTWYYLLFITGDRHGKRHQFVGFATVLSDEFTRTELIHRYWQLMNGYPVTSVLQPNRKWKKVRLHHPVYEHYNGPIPPGYEIDHFNRNKAHAYPANLRAVTRSENARNRGRPELFPWDYFLAS